MRNIGDRETITLQDGTELEVIVERLFELSDGVLVTYSVPEWSKEDKKYFLQDYFYPTQEDYSGIISTTGMPTKYSNMTIKDFRWDMYQEDTKIQQKQVEAFLFGFDIYWREKKGLYIYSKTRGSGKTMLACLIANELIKRGLKVKFLPITEYVRMRFEKVDVSKYSDCSVLIIDDLGAEGYTQDNIKTMVYDLINDRYNGHGITIFTSNLTMESCSKDDRIVERVFEMAAPVKMPEVSIRMKKATVSNTSLLRSALNGV